MSCVSRIIANANSCHVSMFSQYVLTMLQLHGVIQMSPVPLSTKRIYTYYTTQRGSIIKFIHRSRISIVHNASRTHHTANTNKQLLEKSAAVFFIYSYKLLMYTILTKLDRIENFLVEQSKTPTYRAGARSLAGISISKEAVV